MTNLINEMFKVHFHNALDKETLEDKECPYCEDGYLDESDCCGGRLLGEGEDYICGSCYEHCSNAECDCQEDVK